MVAQRQAGAAIEGVAEADLAQVVALLLVVTALGQLATIVAGGDPGVEVGGVVGQHALAEQVLGTEGLQQGGLGALEIVVRGGVEAGGDVEAVEAVPEVLRAEAPGRKAPQRAQDGLLVPVGDGGFGSGGADAVDGGEQQVVGGSYYVTLATATQPQQPIEGLLRLKTEGEGGAAPPAGRVSPRALTLVSALGSPPAAQAVRVTNEGGSDMSFRANSTGGPWLLVTPATGLIAPGASADLQISASPLGLEAGTHDGIVSIERNATTGVHFGSIGISVTYVAY